MENNDVSFSEYVVLFALAICGIWFVGQAPFAEFAYTKPPIASTTSLLLLLFGIYVIYTHCNASNRSDRESKHFSSFIFNQLEVVERRFLANCHRAGLCYSASSPCDISKLRESSRNLAPSQYPESVDSEIDDAIEFQLGQLQALVSRPHR